MADQGAPVGVQMVSPEEVTYSGSAEMVIARTVGGGDVAFLAGHAPFIGTLATWSVEVVRPDGRDTFAVHRGFVEVSANQVTILSDVSEAAADIDIERAEAARDRAKAALAADADDLDAAAALERAELRLRVAASD